MPLTGAEKQRRYIQRLKDRAAIAVPFDSQEGIHLLRIIARLRRTMPRNADVMALCDAVEQRSKL